MVLDRRGSSPPPPPVLVLHGCSEQGRDRSHIGLPVAALAGGLLSRKVKTRSRPWRSSCRVQEDLRRREGIVGLQRSAVATVNRTQTSRWSNPMRRNKK